MAVDALSVHYRYHGNYRYNRQHWNYRYNRHHGDYWYNRCRSFSSIRSDWWRRFDELLEIEFVNGTIEESEDSNNGLAIALGIIIPSIVIIVGLLIVYVWYQR